MEILTQILKAEQERQGNLVDDLVKAMDIQNRQEKSIDDLVKATDIQSLKAELEQLKKDGVDKESKIHFLTAELERQGKLIGDLNMQLNNQSLREEQNRLGKLIKDVVQESEKHNLWFNTHKCAEAKLSGVYETIVPNLISHPFKVACDAETRGGGWTIILRRMDGTVDFYRNWAAYKEGFGNLNGEFFLGLDKIHALTEERNQELLFVVEDFEGNERFEMYDSFAIGDEDQQYILHTLGNASGTAGDSLDWHRGMKFSTYDRDNDSKKDVNCAVSRTGAWWYNGCLDSDLAGRYNDNRWAKGVIWNTFKGQEYSLKKAVMMIRPTK
ncbi:fibrinogen-like protein A [Drosophila innubila]|uniref:fibrinogen-like protein A n=1 Tax=Drosophila innubila TaxID=198719 RepID=UPI00148C7290|nr:fibrinogen-like protein A [Drosophila innubila]